MSGGSGHRLQRNWSRRALAPQPKPVRYPKLSFLRNCLPATRVSLILRSPQMFAPPGTGRLGPNAPRARAKPRALPRGFAGQPSLSPVSKGRSADSRERDHRSLAQRGCVSTFQRFNVSTLQPPAGFTLLELLIVAAAFDGCERRRDQHHQDRDDSDDDHYFEQRKSEALTQLWQRKSACVPQSRDYGATRAACAVALRSRNYKVGSRKLRNRRGEIGQQRKSEALTQLWQRKSAKTLTLSQREDTAGGERRHKLKRTTKPGNCEPLKRPPSSRTRGTTAWQAEDRIGPRNQ